MCLTYYMAPKLISKLLEKVGVDNNKMSVKLTQAPRVINKSSFQVFQKSMIIQADLIYMTEDKGYNYILNVVDVASRNCDAVPIKGRTAEDVIDGFEVIFKRKYISENTRYLYTDPGTEFKNEIFSNYMKTKGIILRHTFTNRKNQMEKNDAE